MPLLIVNSLGAEMNAYFFIVWSISTILFMIPTNVSMSLFVEGCYEIEKLNTNIKKSIKFIFVLIIPIIIAVFLFGDKILLLFGKVYAQQGFNLLIVLAVSSIPVSINTLYVAVKRVRGEINPIIYMYLFVSLFTILGSYYLIDYIGLLGTGIAWIISNGVAASIVGIVQLKNKFLIIINF